MPLDKQQRFSSKIINVKAFGKKKHYANSINVKNIKCSFLADLVHSVVIRITFKNYSIQAVIYGTVENSKSQVSTLNLELIAFVVLKVDP